MTPPIREQLTVRQEAAIKTARSARTLVEGLNRQISTQKNEISGLRANLADIQNRYELSQTNNTVLTGQLGALSALRRMSIPLEIIKFLLLVVCISYGVNLASSGNGLGWAIVMIGCGLYGLIVLAQHQAAKIK